MGRRWPAHECDDDGGCIHCGHDCTEEAHLRRLGYTYPPSTCAVQDQSVRDRNYARWIAAYDAYDVDDSPYWDEVLRD